MTASRLAAGPGDMTAAAPGKSLAVAPAGGSPPSGGNAASWHPGDMTARATSPILVGRTGQLAVLEGALGPSRRGGPSVILVGGEAGVGKSRLVSEFAARSRAAGARVLTGGCVELGTEGLPFAPFTAVLRELVRELGAEGVAALLPGGVTRDFARLLPEFGPADSDTDHIVARARLFEQMLALLERLADTGPVVLLIEDAHWADRSTRDLLAFLVGRQQILDGVLIIVTYRSDELHRIHPLRPLLAELARLSWVERMDLARLDRRHADELVARILGREPEPALADAVFQRADGNPLFVEELLCDCDNSVPSMLPASLRDMLLIAVRRLPEQTQEVLRAASAGGQRNGHALLAAVTGLPDDDLSRALRPAVEANVLTADTDGYSFRHDLIREATLDDVLPGEHTRLHTRFAEALEADPGLVPPARAAMEQAYHWYAAHDTVRALVSSWRAAEEAGRAMVAHAEQLTLLGRVLELWDKVPDAGQRIGASHLTVLERAARAARMAGEHERGAAFASAALAEVDPAAEPARAALLLEMRALQRGHSDNDEVLADLQTALDLVPPGVADAARARVLVTMATHAGQPYGPDALAAAEEALTLARKASAATTEAAALRELAVLRSRAGDNRAALEMLAQARAIAGQAGAYDSLLRAVIEESHVLEGMGEHERAAKVAQAGIASAQDYGLARSSGTFLAINVAESLFSLGRWDEATDVIEHALALSPTQQDIRAALRQLAGEIAVRRGDLAGAAESAATARAAVGLAGYRHTGQYHIPLARLDIELRLAEGKPTAALAAAADAVARLDLALDPRYAWPLLAAAARAVTAAARAAGRDRALAGQAAELLARLRALAAQMPVNGPVQQADRLAFSAEALRAQEAVRSAPAAPAAAAGRAEQEIPAAWDAAAAAWERVGQPYPLAVALLRAAEAALAAGYRDGAAERLRRAAELADNLRARPLAVEIGALARNARIRPADGQVARSAAAATPLGLTARELEVLRLVAHGQSNPEIAARLFISAKTASVHVSNIMAKVGVSSRGEAAAAAHRMHLFDDAPAP
jgi:DNA-binding CsgD family transcriptional regulator/tetratricopeptide (TPR) repeat protein